MMRFSESVYMLPFLSILTFPSIGLSKEMSSSLLLVPPFLGRPTQSSITLNIVAGEQSIVCRLKFRRGRESDTDPWQQTKDFPINAFSPAEITLGSLLPGALYRYQLYARLMDSTEFQLVTARAFRTQRAEPSPFSFAIISDSHITPFNGDRSEILSRISSSILARKPEFLLVLGDNIQTFTSHGGPMTEQRFGPLLYLLLRKGLDDLPSSVPVYVANGNWEGENGWHPDREREWARQARKAFVPNPGANTYPEGGSKDEDYYGFRWGDALCLVLNVSRYTPKDHALQSPIGKADDWTLGEKQKAWLFNHLAKSKARWKLLFMHHTVGGNAGDKVNSRYGRGGGRAAKNW